MSRRLKSDRPSDRKSIIESNGWFGFNTIHDCVASDNDNKGSQWVG
ncbi:MAG: hypothetical protein MK169_05525 [Candidatus Thalassarchaeum sp.]|nr:hypothetical protein [Candidatus Thalassarchaeum sp.]